MPNPELLRDIATQPLDDQLRRDAALAYELEGQPERARFIRTQLMIAALPFGIDDPQWFALTRESRQLLLEYEGRWLEADGLFAPESGRFRFDRGFVELVEMSVPDILQERLGPLVAGAPIRHVDVLPADDDFEPAALFQALAQQIGQRVISLELAGLDLRDDHVGLFTERTWPQLRWLSLEDNFLTRDGIALLAQSWTERTPALEFVDLMGNEFDPAHELEYDQDVVLRWRGEEVDDLEVTLGRPIPWLRPMLDRGRIRPIERLEFGRPQHVRRSGARG